MSGTSIFAYFLLAASVVYVFVYPPYTEVSLLNDEKQKYQSYLDATTNIENKKNELITQMNKISTEDRERVDAILPNSLDFVKLISQIDNIARGQGIVISNISTKDLDPSVGSSIENAGPAQPYQSSSITFSFKASYPNFRKFMDSLEKSLRVLDARSVKISPQSNNLYLYTVEFETYWLK